MFGKVKGFFASEPAAGVVLMLTAILSLLLANSAYSAHYFGVLQQSVFGLSVLHWVNDGLMAVFFLYVGLEVKREFIQGQLASNAQRLLPGLAALVGLVVPALIYLYFNQADATLARGWAVPTATDIAFALGVLALLGTRVPVSMKIFLTALAIMDDLAAIVIIALFYTAQLKLGYLFGAVAILVALILCNRAKVINKWIYITLGLLLWLLVLKSGIHATLAGVALALTIPLRDVPANHHGDTPLLAWEHSLGNWVGFLVIPIFGFANAGVSFANVSWAQLSHPLVLGITLGLSVGKQAGIFGLVFVGEKLGLLQRPKGATWWHVYGIALLCGIGFTMSLFISLLAFEAPELQDLSKLGVFAGSLLSGVLGYLILRSQKAIH